jgi:hypothetical protein
LGELLNDTPARRVSQCLEYLAGCRHPLIVNAPVNDVKRSPTRARSGLQAEDRLRRRPA